MIERSSDLCGDFFKQPAANIATVRKSMDKMKRGEASEKQHGRARAFFTAT
ncbi:MAG TPA: hypothetical protein VND42_05035 [Candidatus Acidoferrales bacterium]|nr:hypothetical protein [Candidatus Acidoferrales bacterium]